LWCLYTCTMYSIYYICSIYIDYCMGRNLVRTSHKLGPQLVRISHKPGPQLVRYLGFGPQLTNTDCTSITHILIQFRRGQPPARLTLEITQSKYYIIFIMFWIYIFILWKIIFITLHVFSCIMVYFFNFFEFG
jgi:hypothetical protein